MNTLDILHALKSKPEIANNFYGVYPCDYLPTKIRLPAFLICNSDPARKNGVHWCAIYVSKTGDTEFFNSFGSLQPIQKEFRDFLNANSSKGYTASNTKRLQSDYSMNCGNFCCMYLFYRACNKSMCKFLAQFSNKQLKQNDDKVMGMYSKIFKRKPTNTNSTQIGGYNMCNQKCKARRNKQTKEYSMFFFNVQMKY